MSAPASIKTCPPARGLWLFHLYDDSAELQDLETGLCLEVRPTSGEDGLFSLCRYDAASCEEEETDTIQGCDVASGLSREGAFRLIRQLAERVGALDLKDFQEPA